MKNQLSNSLQVCWWSTRCRKWCTTAERDTRWYKSSSRDRFISNPSWTGYQSRVWLWPHIAWRIQFNVYRLHLDVSRIDRQSAILHRLRNFDIWLRRLDTLEWLSHRSLLTLKVIYKNSSSYDDCRCQALEWYCKRCAWERKYDILCAPDQIRRQESKNSCLQRCRVSESSGDAEIYSGMLRVRGFV